MIDAEKSLAQQEYRLRSVGPKTVQSDAPHGRGLSEDKTEWRAGGGDGSGSIAVAGRALVMAL